MKVLRQLRAASSEWKLDCFPQGLHFELPGVCHKPNVVKILHATVADVERNHCMELLSNCGFARVRTNQRCFHREEHRKGGKLRFGVNGIAKTDIDLHRNSRS